MRTSFAAALLMLMGTAHAAENSATQEKLSTALQNLAKSKQAEAELKKKLDATEHEMDAMRERATNLAERLQASERRVSSEEEALEKVSGELSVKRREFEARKADYTATVLGLLRMRGMPATAVFASGEEAQTLMRTASVLEKTNEAVAAKATALRRDLEQMHALQTTAKQRDASTRAEKEKLKAEQEKLAREIAARQKLQSKLTVDHEAAEKRVAELSRESQSLQELLGKLAEREKEKPKDEKAAAKTAKLRNFEGKKGSARAPVAGEVIHRFGDKQNGNGTYRGLVFKARPGATVVAPFDGEIVFTGPFRDYGNMVLIKHKNGYISLIAGLGKVNASLNQTASRGEPIGTMPEEGKSEAYVELRDQDAKPIDPADWFANVGG